MSSIYEFVRQQRDDYRSQSITIAEGYDFSQYETLRTIEIHHNSRFLSGNKDSLGRERSRFQYLQIPRQRCHARN